MCSLPPNHTETHLVGFSSPEAPLPDNTSNVTNTFQHRYRGDGFTHSDGDDCYEQPDPSQQPKLGFREKLITDLERFKNFGTPFTSDMADHVIDMFEAALPQQVGEPAGRNYWTGRAQGYNEAIDQARAKYYGRKQS